MPLTMAPPEESGIPKWPLARSVYRALGRAPHLAGQGFKESKYRSFEYRCAAASLTCYLVSPARCFPACILCPVLDLVRPSPLAFMQRTISGPDIERIFRTRGCSEILSANEAPQGRSYERTDFCSFDSYRMRGHSESIISE